MKAPLYVRSLTGVERAHLQDGLRSPSSFTMRRCQILLASDRGQKAQEIAELVGCSDQTVRDVVRAFEQRGLDCLEARSHRTHTKSAVFDERGVEQLREMLHQSPRCFDKPTSRWTLDLAAEVAFETGLTSYRVSDECIRETLLRANIRWKRAKRWITSPDPQYLSKKKRRDRLIALSRLHPEWALGFQDETWWSRTTQPTLHAWCDSADTPRLVAQTLPKDDPDPKAIACYGLLLKDYNEGRSQILLRFVDGQPVSQVTIEFLTWCCKQLEAQGKTALLMVWDNASWHISHKVATWMRYHNQAAKATLTGVRRVSCPLPIKSPWLNPIEPHWLHAKRNIAETERPLTYQEIPERVYAYFGCPNEEPLTISRKST